MHCSFCPNDATHSYCFPGEARVFLCRSHADPLGGHVIRTTDASATLSTSVLPLEPEAPPPPAAVMCTVKAHNPKHVAPAVLHFDCSHEGVAIDNGAHDACAACVREMVNAAQVSGWKIHLTELEP